jgi:thioredoxin 1
MFLKTLAAGFAAVVLLATSAFAATPYTPEAFAAAQSENRPILVEVWAEWCPTCKRQSEIIESLQGGEQFADLVVLRVDYDSQRDAVRNFRANRQSTLVVFRGEEETGRAVGITQEREIVGLIETAYDR